jgi:glyoxylase-like metal-dependent hydrolase (beta-lactamase superfamily II)
VVDAGLVDLIEPDHAICSELTLRPTPGHTPGHVSIAIESRGKRALVSGDMMHHPIQLERPDDTGRFDMDQAMARRTRVELIDDLANSDVFVIGSHFSEPTGGFIVRDAKGCRLAQQPARKK